MQERLELTFLKKSGVRGWVEEKELMCIFLVFFVVVFLGGMVEGREIMDRGG